MKTALSNIEHELQVLALRSIELVDRIPIRKIIDEMNIAISDLNPGQERLLLKAFIDKLEGVL